MRGFIRWGLWLIIPGMMAAFRGIPGLASRWEAFVALPLLSALHRLTLKCPFPILEPMIVLALALSLRRRGWRYLRRLFWGALTVFALLWYPAYWASPAADCETPEPARLEELCSELVDSLSRSSLRFTLTPSQAGDGAIKAARYPEWMRALGISGLFVPWTGEIIVDPDLPPERVPFTCVHERMHLEGIADEGAANIAAYRECLRRGGQWADSARLCALRYALPLLLERDPHACRRIVARMDATLIRLLPSTAKTYAPHPLMRLLGLSRPTSDYADLVGWLAGNEVIAAAHSLRTPE